MLRNFNMSLNSTFSLLNELFALVLMQLLNALNVFKLNHTGTLLNLNARSGVFEDSGAWETALLRLSELIIRGCIWSTILPISEQGIGEQISSKIISLLAKLSKFGETRIILSTLTSLSFVLTLCAAGLGLYILMLIFV